MFLIIIYILSNNFWCHTKIFKISYRPIFAFFIENLSFGYNLNFYNFLLPILTRNLFSFSYYCRRFSSCVFPFHSTLFGWRKIQENQHLPSSNCSLVSRYKIEFALDGSLLVAQFVVHNLSPNLWSILATKCPFLCIPLFLQPISPIFSICFTKCPGKIQYNQPISSFLTDFHAFISVFWRICQNWYLIIKIGLQFKRPVKIFVNSMKSDQAKTFHFYWFYSFHTFSEKYRAVIATPNELMPIASHPTSSICCCHRCKFWCWWLPWFSIHFVLIWYA